MERPTDGATFILNAEGEEINLRRTPENNSPGALYIKQEFEKTNRAWAKDGDPDGSDWVRFWGTVKDGLGHLWLSVEFIPDSYEMMGEIGKFAQKYDGCLWEMQIGKTPQFSVDINVSKKSPQKRVELLKAIVAEIHANPLLYGHRSNNENTWAGVVAL